MKEATNRIDITPYLSPPEKVTKVLVAKINVLGKHAIEVLLNYDYNCRIYSERSQMWVNDEDNYKLVATIYRNHINAIHIEEYVHDELLELGVVDKENVTIGVTISTSNTNYAIKCKDSNEAKDVYDWLNEWMLNE